MNKVMLFLSVNFVILTMSYGADAQQKKDESVRACNMPYLADVCVDDSKEALSDEFYAASSFSYVNDTGHYLDLVTINDDRVSIIARDYENPDTQIALEILETYLNMDAKIVDDSKNVDFDNLDVSTLAQRVRSGEVEFSYRFEFSDSNIVLAEWANYESRHKLLLINMKEK